MAGKRVGEQRRSCMRTARVWAANNFGDDGARAIADALRVNSTVIEVDLRCTPAHAASRRWRVADVCAFEANNIGDDGARAFADTIRVNSTLCKVDLGSTCPCVW
jgi:hypothetical protein